MTIFSRLLTLSLMLALPAAAQAERSAAADAMDERLAAIGDRLAIANVALCDRIQPRPGWVLHAVDQYLAQPIAPGTRVDEFPTPVAVMVVVPGAPAAAAGVRPDDGIVSVAGREMPVPPPGKPSSATRDAAEAIVAGADPAAPLPVTLRRGAADRAVTIAPRAGCRATFEALAAGGLGASSDGRVIQLGAGFARFTDAEVAVVAAHELAHVVLHHRERLERAGVTWGLLAEFGRSRRLFRRTEDDADALSVALLYNAGYDPASAAAFWRAHGTEVGGGFFRARTHGSAGARATALAAAAAAIPPAAARPYRPAILATRDQPLG